MNRNMNQRALKSIIIAIILCVSPVMSWAGACHLERRKAADGIERVILSNNWVRVEVLPEQGGAVSSFIYLPTGEEMTADKPDQTSLVCFLQGYRTEFAGGPYRLEILKESPEELVVALHWISGSDRAPLKFISMKRTLRLCVNESQLHVTVDLQNMGEQMMPIYPLPRFFNSIRFFGQAMKYYIPAESGVREIPYELNMGTREIWEYKPSRGWMAGVGEKGSGFAFDLSECFQYLMCYYFYLGRDEMPTSEWMYRTLTVPDGQSLVSNFRLLAFAGLKRVDAVGNGVAVEVAVEEPKLATERVTGKIRLAFTCDREVTLTAQMAKAGDKAETKVLQDKISGAPGTLKEVPFEFNPVGEGTYVLTGRIAEGEKLICDFQRVVTIGKPSADVVWQPLEKRLGDTNQCFSNSRPGLLPSTAEKDLLSWDTEANITPHFKWARPLEGGPVNALVLCDYFNGREVMELAQRLDLKLDTFTIISGYFKYWYYLDREQGVKQLADYLVKKPYDVVVLGGISGQYLKEDGQKALLEYLNKGGGLVYIMPNQLPEAVRAVMPLYPSDKGWKEESLFRNYQTPQSVWQPVKEHYLTAGFPYKAMPPVYASADVAKGDILIQDTQGRPVLAIGKVGKGRVVALGYGNGFSWNYYTGLTPWIRRAPVQFDYHEYYFSLLSKAILFAAGRKPAVELASLVASEQGDIDLVLRAAEGKDVTIMAEWTDRFGRVAGEKKSDVLAKPGDTKTHIGAPPELRLDGLHLVRTRIFSQKKILDWGATSFERTAPARILNISAPEEFYRSFQKIPVMVKLAGKDGTKGKLRLDVMDLYGRLIAREERLITIAGGMTVDVILSLPEVIAQSAQIRAYLSDGELVVSEAHKDILLKPEETANRSWDDWMVTIWSGPDTLYTYEYFYPQIARRLQDAGIGALYVNTNGKKPWMNIEDQAGLSYRMGFRVVSSECFNRDDIQDQDVQTKIADYAKTGEKKYLERNPSLNAPSLQARFDSLLSERIPPIVPYSPIGYDFADELSFTYYTHAHDFDFSPHSIRALREWLHGEYQTLDALNESWETQFKMWDEVVPMTEQEAREHASFAPWCDQRTFNEATMAEIFQRAVNKIRSFDPKARCGLSGTQMPVSHNGYDYSRFMRVFDLMFGYVHSPWVAAIQKSFAPAKLSFWMNNDNTRDEYWRRGWEQFLRGYNGSANCTEHTLLNPDMTPRYDFKDFCDVNRQFMEGAGRLMMSYKRSPNLAIHYSQPSIHAAFMAKCSERYQTSNEAWVYLLNDLGYSSVYMDQHDLVAGKLNEFDIFVLPMSMAVSDVEAKIIHEFVRRGGLLLTDAFIGWTDEHGNWRRGGKLDDVLGLHFPVAPGKLPESPRGREVTAEGGRTLFLPVACANPQINGAKARIMADKSPTFLVNDFGRGKAVTLNTYVSGYLGQRKRGAGDDWRQVLRPLLAFSGVKPHCRVTNPDGSERTATDQGYFADGENGLLVLLTQSARVPDDEAIVELPLKKYVTDVLSRHPFGLTAQTRIKLKPCEGRILALLSYQVKAVNINVPHIVKAGDEARITLRVDAGDAKAGRHVLRFKVFGPEGRPSEPLNYYTHNLLAENGKCDLRLPIALNAKPGMYTIRVSDVASAVMNEASFTVADTVAESEPVEKNRRAD